jgi:hypothetical protein
MEWLGEWETYGVFDAGRNREEIFVSVFLIMQWQEEVIGMAPKPWEQVRRQN